MALTSRTIWTNMAHLQYHPRQCHIKATQQVWWTYWINWLSYCVNMDDGNRQTDRRTDGRTDRRTDGQTQVTTITLRPKRPRVKTRTRWRRVKTLGQHQVGVNLQSHAQHQLWNSTWHIFHEFHKIMPSLSYPVSLVNQNVILVNISHWRLHMAWIMSLMST